MTEESTDRFLKMFDEALEEVGEVDSKEKSAELGKQMGKKIIGEMDRILKEKK